MGSLIEPDQLPAGETKEDVVVGEVGVALPLHPATLTITAAIAASRRFIWPPASEVNGNGENAEP
jgi:hypothetical protein